MIIDTSRVKSFSFEGSKVAVVLTDGWKFRMTWKEFTRCEVV